MDPNQFLFMKECLKEFNYPNIHSMDEPEITDIFSKINRQFLVKWLLKELDDDYCEIVENASKPDLAEIVFCNGWCQNLEKKSFLEGECDIQRQFIILYGMFKSLKNVRDAKKIPESKNISLEEIEELKNIDTNLFPMYGPKVTLTASQREKKIKEFCKEIEDLKNIIDSASTFKNESLDLGLQEQLFLTKQKFDENFPDFARKVFELMKNSNDILKKKVEFGEDFAATLESCTKDTQSILQFVKSIMLIGSFEENTVEVDYDNNNLNTAVREIADLCNEITYLKKRDSYLE